MARTTLTPERRALYEQLQMVTAGHSVETVICALADSLASSVGFAAEDRGHADRLIEDLVPDMKQSVRENWDYLREVRSTAFGAGRS